MSSLRSICLSVGGILTLTLSSFWAIAHPLPRTPDPIIVGAERMEVYLPLLQGKRIALVCNHTSLVDRTLLPDTLLSLGIDIARIFTPEHGFAGTADAGEHIGHSRDKKRKLDIISLYGSSKRPSEKHLQGVDLILFDLQDVGVRCYTYISTLQYVIDACVTGKIPLIVLDRPNPNGHYVDGPLLDTVYRSFVGMHPVPWVHGMTIGEFARMIQGEWLPHGTTSLDLTVIPCLGYTHTTRYTPPVPPSPNLPNERAILLYPSLALFEGTNLSVGRGTKSPFQIVGSPYTQSDQFSFIPQPRPGAKHPPHKGLRCHGLDLRRIPIDSLREDTAIRLEIIQQMLRMHNTKRKPFFIPFFHQLAGTRKLRADLERQQSQETIRAAWQDDLQACRRMRAKYLLYP